MSDEQKLFSCPFCGGKAEAKPEDHGIVKTFEYDCWSVECTACRCGTPIFDDVEDAILAWNKRT